MHVIIFFFGAAILATHLSAVPALLTKSGTERLSSENFRIRFPDRRWMVFVCPLVYFLSALVVFFITVEFLNILWQNHVSLLVILFPITMIAGVDCLSVAPFEIAWRTSPLVARSGISFEFGERIRERGIIRLALTGFIGVITFSVVWILT